MKIKKKLFSFVIVISLILLCASNIYADVTDKDIIVSTDIPSIKAKSIIIMDANTGITLYEQSANQSLYVSYLSKLMTILLTAEALNEGKITLDKELTTSKNANSQTDPQLWLNIGETITVEDALQAICMANPNDVAMVLAEELGKTEDGFISMMNEKSKLLKLENTNFSNVTGVDCDNQYSSARDIAIISKEILKYETLLPYLTQWMIDLRNGQTNVVNTNKLVRSYKGITGLKAVASKNSGCCISISAKRNQMHLICVIIGAPDNEQMFCDAKTLLDYAFSVNSYFEPQINLDTLSKIKVIGGETSQVLLKAENKTGIIIPNGTANNIRAEVTLPKQLSAPVKQNQIVGEITFYNDDKIILTTNIIAANEVNKKSVKFCIKKLLSYLLNF